MKCCLKRIKMQLCRAHSSAAIVLSIQGQKDPPFFPCGNDGEPLYPRLPDSTFFWLCECYRFKSHDCWYIELRENWNWLVLS